MRNKRITVQILGQLCDTGGEPLGTDGKVYGRNWKSHHHWTKARLSNAAFCPKNVADGLRVVFYENYPRDPQPVKCSCHNKIRLVNGRISIGETERQYLNPEQKKENND